MEMGIHGSFDDDVDARAVADHEHNADENDALRHFSLFLRHFLSALLHRRLSPAHALSQLDDQDGGAYGDNGEGYQRRNCVEDQVGQNPVVGVVVSMMQLGHVRRRGDNPYQFHRGVWGHKASQLEQKDTH